MASGMFGPGRSTGQHTRAAQQERQRQAQMQDTNASAHPNKVTMADLKRGKR
jgi:hypothetical protein